MRMIYMLLVVGLAAGCATGPDKVVSVQLAKSTRSWDGALLPAYPAGQPEVTILKITIPPGMRLPPHFHPVINAGVLTRGTLTVYTLDGKRNQLHAGEAIIEVVETVHYGANEGKVPAEIVVFYAGAEGGDITLMPPAP
jgi:quercetin dioxygenase-like cupin family protein